MVNNEDGPSESISQSRRRFLLAGSSVASTFALPQFVGRSSGERTKKVPLVWTRDGAGNPDRVRYIPKERRRRIKVYKNLNMPLMMEQNPALNEVSIKQRSNEETDLALQFHLDENTRSVRQKSPSSVEQVPVEFEERPIDGKPKADSTTTQPSALNPDNSCRVGDSYGTMEANIGVGPNSAYDNDGTLGVVGWNASQSNAYLCLITADHVMDSAPTMYQKYTAVGDLKDATYAMDTTKYKVRSGIDTNIKGTRENSQPEMTGSWTFGGLTDATSGGTVSCGYAGKETCYTATECDNTSRNERVTYEADMKNVVTEPGDSGGPFVDANGDLVCTLFGYQVSSGTYWDRGPVGANMLGSVDAQLAYPF